MRHDVLTFAFPVPQDDSFGQVVHARFIELLPPRWKLRVRAKQKIRWERSQQGAWSLIHPQGRIAIDDLAIGAAAARHLIALGCRYLFVHAGAGTEQMHDSGTALRVRGFLITAAALGMQAQQGLPVAQQQQVGLFIARAQIEAESLAHLAKTAWHVPRDLFVLGCDDASLPAPSVPQVSRLYVDPRDIARVLIQQLNNTGDRLGLVAPSAVMTRSSNDGLINDPRLSAMLHYIAAHLERPIGVAELATAAGMSRRHLERQCRKILACSPLDELRRQRLQRVQELLLSTDLTLQHIAARSGFSNPERLGMVFKQFYDVSPGQWRRQHRASS